MDTKRTDPMFRPRFLAMNEARQRGRRLRCGRLSPTGRLARGGAMAGRDVYLDHLASVPLFAACSRKDLQKIARASDEVSIAEGCDLMRQDEIGRECFVLVEGTVKVTRNGRRVATLGPGSYFGELSLLD